MFETIRKKYKQLIQSEEEFKSNGNDRIYKPVDPDILLEYNQTRAKGPQPVLCYAPFKSIYWGHYGKAIACCQNRTNILGVFPRESIRDIWFGEKANLLREYIIHNDLSAGCGSCDVLMKGKNYDGLKAKMYDEYPEYENKFPSIMEFELNNICNLECEMCSGDFSHLIRKNKEKRAPYQTPYDDKFVDQLEEFIPYLREVKFYGGEPFLTPIYFDIWDMIIALNPECRISVQTNASVLNNRVKELLSKADFHLNISIDSLEKETYEIIRKNAKFETVWENMLYFRRYCHERNTFFGISACAMRQNWKELPSFIRKCNELETPVYFHSVWFPANCSIWNMDSQALKEIYDFLAPNEFPVNTPIQKKNRQHFMDIVNQINKWYYDSMKKEEVLNKRSEIEEMIGREATSYVPNLENPFDDQVLTQGSEEMQLLSLKEPTRELILEKVDLYLTQQESCSEKERMERLAQLADKFNELISKLPADFPKKEFYVKLNEFLPESVMETIELNSVDYLLESAGELVA